AFLPRITTMAKLDYFLKIDGIEGESTDAAYPKALDVESYSWSGTQSGTFTAGSGGGAGKVKFHDFHFTAKVSKASPKLMLAMSTGEHFKKAVLTCRKAGAKQQEYCNITLSDVLVSTYHQGGQGSGDTLPLDEFTLNFAKFELDYKPQNQDGTLGASVKVG